MFWSVNNSQVDSIGNMGGRDEGVLSEGLSTGTVNENKLEIWPASCRSGCDVGAAEGRRSGFPPDGF